jgi:hypothetical protein
MSMLLALVTSLEERPLINKVRFEIWRQGTEVQRRDTSASRVVFGKDPSATIVCDYPDVATRHVVVDVEANDACVRSYAGENVRHNGADLTAGVRCGLFTGDVIEIGELQIIVSIECDPPASRDVLLRVESTPRPESLRLAAALLLAVSEPEMAHFATKTPALVPASLDILLDIDDQLATAELMARACGQSVTPDVARQLCSRVASHPDLACLVPVLADLPGWSTIAARACRSAVPAMLGHDYWRVRIWSAFFIHDPGARGRALSAVRRSFVESGFSCPIPTTGQRPGRAHDYTPDIVLPLLPQIDEARRSKCADLSIVSAGGSPPSAPGPLELGDPERRLLGAVPN